MAGTAIVAGAALGLVVSYNVVADAREQVGYVNVQFAVPWLELAVVFAVVILVALLTTLAATARTTHLYPAEALRYR